MLCVCVREIFPTILVHHCNEISLLCSYDEDPNKGVGCGVWGLGYISCLHHILNDKKLHWCECS